MEDILAGPELAVQGDGCVVTTSWVAVLGLTTMLSDAVGVTPPALVVKLRFMVSAVL